VLPNSNTYKLTDERGGVVLPFHCNRYEFIMQYAGGAANSRINNRVDIVNIDVVLIVSFS
jgi:hypothetical protein